MLNIPLLLVGDATDGPTDEWVAVDSLDHILRLYGAYQYEQITLASGSTGYTLQNAPWGNDVTAMKVATDGALSEQRLYDFSISGSVLSWSPPGDTITGPIIFRVLVEASGTSLVRGILNTAKVGAAITVVRLGGTHGKAPGVGFNFVAIYAGQRYNGTTILVTGGVVTVTPAPGTGRVRTYTPKSDVDLRIQMSSEVARGSGPVLLDVPLSQSALTIPPGLYTVTGGTDGQLTPELFEEFVDENDLSGVDVICPMGLTTEQVSGVMSVLDGTNYPTLVVAQASTVGNAITGVINTSRYLCSSGFNTTYEAGSRRERIDPGASLLAAIISTNNFSSTLAPLPEFPPSPLYDPQSIAIVAASGHTVAYKSISKSWALWRVNTGDPDWPVSSVRAFQEVVRPIYENLEPVLGQNLIDIDTLNSLLEEAFKRVVGSQVIDWNLALHGDTLYVDVSFRPYGEVRVIQAQVALGSQSTASP